jgi:hypothetical protein
MSNAMTYGVMNAAVFLKQMFFVVLCVKSPESCIVTAMHVANLMFRLVLLSTGCIWFTLVGYDEAPGIGHSIFTPKNPYHHDTGMGRWSFDAPILLKGNIFIPCVWSIMLLILIWTDMVRLRHIVAGRFYSHTNHLDLTWHVISTCCIPLLMTCTALQLGMDDLYMISILLVCSLLAGLCDFLGEELFLLYTKEFHKEQEALRADLTWTTSYMYLILITVSLLFATSPILFTAFRQDHTVPLSRWLTIVVIFKFVVLLVVVQVLNFRSYRMLQKTRSDHRGLVRPIPYKRLQCRLSINNDTMHTDKEVVYESEKSSDLTSDHLEGDSDPFNTNTSERIFNAIYGCYVHNEHHAEARAMGSVNPVSCTDHDGDGNGTQRKVGMLVEWRRHYLLSMFINTLLICILFQITGVEINI